MRRRATGPSPCERGVATVVPTFPAWRAYGPGSPHQPGPGGAEPQGCPRIQPRPLRKEANTVAIPVEHLKRLEAGLSTHESWLATLRRQIEGLEARAKFPSAQVSAACGRSALDALHVHVVQPQQAG